VSLAQHLEQPQPLPGRHRPHQHAPLQPCRPERRVDPPPGTDPPQRGVQRSPDPGERCPGWLRGEEVGADDGDLGCRGEPGARSGQEASVDLVRAQFMAAGGEVFRQRAFSRADFEQQRDLVGERCGEAGELSR